MKHKIIFHKILLFIIACIAFFGTVMTQKATKDVIKAYEYKGAIEDMMDSDDEIDFALKRTFLQADYDATMRYAASLKNDLLNLSSGKLASFERLAIGEGAVNEIRETFDQKSELIDKFNSLSALAKLSFEETMLKFSSLNDSRFSELLPKILLIRYGINADINGAKELLKSYESLNLNEREKDFLQSAQKLLRRYEEADRTLASIQDLNLSKKLYELRSKNDAYVERVTSNLRGTTIFVFVLFGITAAFIYLSYTRARNNIRLLNRFEQAVDNSFNSIAFTDLNKQVRYVNKIFEQNTGYKFEEISGKNINLLKSGLHPQEFYQRMLDTIENDNIWRADELISKTKSGKLIREQVVFSPLFNEKGYKDGYMAIKFDRTK